MNYIKLLVVGLATILMVSFLVYFKMTADHVKIPLEVLFGNPQKMCVRLAPGGSKIAYLKPDAHDRLQVWVTDITGQNERKITNNTHRSITQFMWSYDNEHVFYLQDRNGNENWSLYQTNIDSGETKSLTNFDNVQVRILRYRKQLPDYMVLGINHESKQRHDPYLLNLKTGELTLLGASPHNALDLLIDNDLKFIGALVSTDDGSHQFVIKDHNEWKPIIVRGHEDNFEPLFLSKDNRYLYVLDSANSNSECVVKVDLHHPDQIELIACDLIYDATSVMYDSNTYVLQAVRFNKERQQWLIIDDTIKADFDYLKQLHHGDFNVVSRTNDDNLWIVAFNQDVGPVGYFLYDRSVKKAIFLFYHSSELLKYSLQPMHPIKFQSRDGLTIHGYMTYPKNYSNGKVPLIVYVHGGPWLRDSWGYDPVTQWFANRGYAVVQINFRGSTGYGKAFFNAGNKQWGKKMLDDLVDGAIWAQKDRHVDASRIAIYGGSYGGYAALCGATFTQGVFKCAVDICGRSNVFSRFTAIPEYWKAYIATQKHRIGDPDTEADLIKEASPLFYADQIKIPLFMAHGTNDARINPEESEKIVEILKKNNVPHEYLAFPDEGHSFVKAHNRLICFAAIEKFLEKYL